MRPSEAGRGMLAHPLSGQPSTHNHPKQKQPRPAGRDRIPSPKRLA